MTELTNRCLSLNREDRVKMIKLLQESLAQEIAQEEERFQVMFKITTEMFGHGITANSRNFNLVLGRRFIAYQMVSEGYSRSLIAKLLRKCYTSVTQMLVMMDEVFKYPKIYALDIAYWNEFQYKLKEYDKTRTI